MNKTNKHIAEIFIRYILLLVVAIPNLYLFYFIFTPLTLVPLYFLLNLIFGATIIGNAVLTQCTSITIIDACVAGAAYYLLLILILTTPKITIDKRIKMIVVAFLSFLVINIFRIFILSILAINKYPFFDSTHQILWYGISTVAVVAIWFAEVRYFKIKEIPFFSDLKFLYVRSSFK